jgi:DNA-binding transcriptional LysR family regulator
LPTSTRFWRSGNITVAARLLNVSQPAVTGHLKALEAELGSPLFVRLARGVSPTSLAHRLADDVTAPLDALHESIRGFHPSAPVGKATCFIGGPADALSVLVVPALATLIADGLRLHIRTGLTGPLIEALSDGELDLVIATTPVRRRNVVSEPLFDERLVLVAASHVVAGLDRRLRRRDPVRALADVPLVAYDDTAPLVRRYFRAHFPGTAPPDPYLAFPDLRGLQTVVRSGVGWTVLPDYLVDNDLASGALALVHEPPTATTNTLFLAARASRRHHRAVAAVHDRLTAALRPETVPLAARSTPPAVWAKLPP